MDFNLVILQGRLAAPPEIRDHEGGARVARYLLAVQSNLPRRRLDVIPVTLWNPPGSLVADPPAAGARMWTAGSVQRRFWNDDTGRRSRVEIVAQQIEFPADPSDER